MLDLTFADIINLIIEHGYWIIFAISIPEGPVVGILAGVLVAQGYLNGIIVFIILLLGDIFGDIVHYAIGRWTRNGFLEKYGKYIGASPEKLAKTEKYFEKHHWKILTFAKTQAIGSVFLLAAGAVRAPFGKFVWYNVLGTIPKVLILESIGFYFGKSYASIGKYVDYAGIGSFLLAILLILIYWIYKYYSKTRIKFD